MSNYKGHTLGGISAGIAYIAVLSSFAGTLVANNLWILSKWQMAVALLIVAVLFALWPDIDTNSMGQNIFFGLAFVADIVLIVIGRFEAAAYLGLLAMTPIVGKHRGWTHSFIAMVAVPLPIVLFPYINNRDIWMTGLIIYGAAVSGYFSHLLLDGKVKRLLR